MMPMHGLEDRNFDLADCAIITLEDKEKTRTKYSGYVKKLQGFLLPSSVEMKQTISSFNAKINIWR